MSVEISDSEISDNGEYILTRLPGWMPIDRETGNFRLLDAVGHSIDQLEGDIDDADKAASVQQATTIDQLKQLAELVNLPPNSNEGKEKYRSRIIAEYQNLTNEGTADEIVKNSATILDVDIEKVGYEKIDHHFVELTVPGNALDNLSITRSQFVDIARDLLAAGFNLRAIRRGTFTYLSDASYTGPYDSANGGYDPASLTSDASKGHDGLDSNGNPKDNGGTHAGLIE